MAIRCIIDNNFDVILYGQLLLIPRIIVYYVGLIFLIQPSNAGNRPCVEKHMEFCRVTSTHTQRAHGRAAWLPKRPLSSPPVCATAPREGTPLTVSSIKAHYGLSS